MYNNTLYKENKNKKINIINQTKTNNKFILLDDLALLHSKDDNGIFTVRKFQ